MSNIDIHTKMSMWKKYHPTKETKMKYLTSEGVGRKTRSHDYEDLQEGDIALSLQTRLGPQGNL